MKAIIGTLALGLMMTGSTFAQDANDDKKVSYISVGPAIGGGHSWVSNMVNTYKPAANAGVNIIYSKDENWGFGGLATISHEGYAQDVFVGGQTYTNYYDPTYARLTPRAYYFFGDYGDNVRPKVYAGPSVGFKLNEDKYLYEPMPLGDANLMYGTESFRNVDFGANVGVGVNIKVYKRAWLNIDADYYHGFVDVTRMNATVNQNRGIGANFGLNFGI